MLVRGLSRSGWFLLLSASRFTTWVAREKWRGKSAGFRLFRWSGSAWPGHAAGQHRPPAPSRKSKPARMASDLSSSTKLLVTGRPVQRRSSDVLCSGFAGIKISPTPAARGSPFIRAWNVSMRRSSLALLTERLGLIAKSRCPTPWGPARLKERLLTSPPSLPR